MIFIPKLHCSVAFREAAVKKCRHQVNKKKRAEFTLCDHCASLHTQCQQTWYWEPISPVCDSFFPSKIQSHMHCVSLSNVGKNTKWQRQKETRRLLIAQHHLGVDGELEHSFRHRFLTPCSYLPWAWLFSGVSLFSRLCAFV